MDTHTHTRVHKHAVRRRYRQTCARTHTHTHTHTHTMQHNPSNRTNKPQRQPQTRNSKILQTSPLACASRKVDFLPVTQDPYTPRGYDHIHLRAVRAVEHGAPYGTGAYAGAQAHPPPGSPGLSYGRLGPRPGSPGGRPAPRPGDAWYPDPGRHAATAGVNFAFAPMARMNRVPRKERGIS